MKLAISVLTLIGTISSASAACPEMKIPAYFEEIERPYKSGADMDLRDKNGKALGVINQRKWKITDTFELRNEQENLVATAKKRLFAWGSTYDVVDCEGKFIGSVKESIWESWSVFYTSYSIKNGQKTTVGESAKAEFFSTRFTISNTSKQEAFKMYRRNESLKSDVWQVNVSNPSLVDYRLVLFVPAFKTSADNYRRAQAATDAAVDILDIFLK